MLKSDSNISSMRWALMQMVRMAFILIMAVSANIIIKSYKATDIDWAGIALFLGGLAAFISTGFAGKWLQKKEEGKHENAK